MKSVTYIVSRARGIGVNSGRDKKFSDNSVYHLNKLRTKDITLNLSFVFVAKSLVAAVGTESPPQTLLVLSSAC